MNDLMDRLRYEAHANPVCEEALEEIERLQERANKWARRAGEADGRRLQLEESIRRITMALDRWSGHEPSTSVLIRAIDDARLKETESHTYSHQKEK